MIRLERIEFIPGEFFIYCKIIFQKYEKIIGV